MKIVQPSFEFMEKINGNTILRLIEAAGRICYKSEDNITSKSAKSFVAGLIKRGHESVLEHAKATIRITCSRGVSHELVRHRLASYSQESTRYCCYQQMRFGKEITVVMPSWIILEDAQLMTLRSELWSTAMESAEYFYFELLNYGMTAQEARGVLPNDLKTEVVITANMREWRTIFKQRTSKAAHPDMKYLMDMILAGFKEKIPVIFDDIISE